MKSFIKSNKKYLAKIAVPLATALITVLLTQNIFFSIKPLQELELKYLDIRFSNKAVRDIKDSANVIILGISQDDYDQIPEPYNSWPWPRSYFANVVNNLKNAGVKAIGIDVLMSNDDKFSADNDKLFEEAILNSQNVVVAGVLDVEAEMQLENGNFAIKNNSYNFRNKFYAVDSSVGIVQIGSDEDGIYRRYEPLVISGVNESILPTFGFVCSFK